MDNFLSKDGLNVSVPCDAVAFMYPHFYNLIWSPAMKFGFLISKEVGPNNKVPIYTVVLVIQSWTRERIPASEWIKAFTETPKFGETSCPNRISHTALVGYWYGKF